MTNPIIASNGLLFLNLPGTQKMVDEIVGMDCYEASTIPDKCRVLDLGACYGVFSIMAAKRGFIVKAVEPSLYSTIILEANMKLNRNPDIRLVRAAAAGTPVAKVAHFYNPENPASSSAELPSDQGYIESVPGMTINQLTTGWDHWAIKMDVEGFERFLLAYPAWLEITDWLSIKFKGDTGFEHGKLLVDKGFSVNMYGRGEKTELAWDPSMSGGHIIAKRSNLSIDG